MKPYYQRGGITIYCGDCREILPGLSGINSIVTDPPYGNNTMPKNLIGGSNAVLSGRYLPIRGDDKPFDPIHLLGYRYIITWGANYYANKLPCVSSWLIWDKKEGGNPDNYADVEMAWTNLGGPARLYHHLWRGRIKKGADRLLQRTHPTQKPIALMAWCIEQIVSPGLVCDPYMGSGPTLKAARLLEYPAIGIEIEERYCEQVARELDQLTIFDAPPPLATPEQARLFND